MKNTIHDSYRELIMEKIDGFISPADNSVLEAHLRDCSDCRVYMNQINVIKKAASEIKFEAPAYLESKIMAAVNEAAGKNASRVFAGFGNRGYIFGAGVSFALVFFVASFLIYNNLNVRHNPVQVAQSAVMPVKQAVSAVVKREKTAVAVAAVKQNVVVAQIKKVPAVSTEKSVPAVSAPANSVVVADNTVPRVYEKHVVTYDYSNVQPRSAPVASANIPQSSNGNAPLDSLAVSANNKNSVSAADSKNTPTPSDAVLDAQIAVVANNMIDTRKAQFATIKVKVDGNEHVKVTIYDKAVRVVAQLIDEDKTPGAYQVDWSGKNENNETVREGVYYVFIQIGNRVIKRNVIVAKQ